MTLLKTARQLRKNDEGATAIEFSLLAFPFFLMIFAIMETSLVFLAELTLDNGVETVARQVRVGTITGTTETAFRSALCDQVKFVLTCSKLNIDVRSYGSPGEITDAKLVASGDIATGSMTYAPGGPGKVTSVRVYYKWPIITDIMRVYLSNMKDGSHLLASTTAFQAENY